ncbi:unnamed protein product [Dovyalis caffra]|uniref:Uncharacterized protein n=1 Tax=Dovyalis caffra TaxID=77055 RepID=A0AAV1RFZ3_9ROSI|nr:unnamed protein product [Dovyalis caffra]
MVRLSSACERVASREELMIGAMATRQGLYGAFEKVAGCGAREARCGVVGCLVLVRGWLTMGRERAIVGLWVTCEGVLGEGRREEMVVLGEVFGAVRGNQLGEGFCEGDL